MEIERKFLIQKMPEHPEQYKSHLIEQAYLNVRPVVAEYAVKMRIII